MNGRVLGAAVSSVLFALVGNATFASAKPPAAHPKPKPGHGPAGRGAPKPPPAKPAPPLQQLPNMSRVRLEVAHDRVVLTQDVGLPRGDWESGDVNLYVAFGVPGPPQAFDAHLLAVPAGEAEPRPEDAGDPVTVETAPHRPVSAQPLLGRTNMLGAVVHVKEAAFRHALEPSGLAILRLRTLIDAPAADPQGARDVIVRLGMPGSTPLTLGRIQVVSIEPHPWVTKVEAQLCGPEADPYPLSVALLPAPVPPPPVPIPLPVAPSLIARHPGDDLCVRFWAK